MSLDPGTLVGQAHDCLDAGADVVLVEAAEMIIDGEAGALDFGA